MPGGRVRDQLTDQDGDGLTDYEEMVLMQNPEIPNEFPRHKSPRERTMAWRNNPDKWPKTFLERMAAGTRTTMASESNRDKLPPTAEHRKTLVASRALGLQADFDEQKEVLKAALKGYHPKASRMTHHVGPSGRINFVSGQSQAARLIEADELWPGADPVYANLTGADPDFALTGLDPLPPIGLWEFRGGIDPAENPELASQLSFGNTTAEIDSEFGDTNSVHAVDVAKVLALADQGDGLQGMAWQSKLKVYTSLNDYAEMATAVANDGMQFSNHSYSVVAGWGENNFPHNWFGPLTPENPTPPLGTSDSPIFEDPEFGAYTLQSKTLDDLIATSKTYLPVYAAGNFAHTNGALSSESNPISYQVILEEPIPGSTVLTTVPNPNFDPTQPVGPNNPLVIPIEWEISQTVPHARNSGPPAPDVAQNNAEIEALDPDLFEGVVDSGCGLGTDTIASAACAKNVLTVGAIFSFEGDINSASDFALRHYSSRGPTDDGRIKPDLVASSNFDRPSGFFNELGGTSQAAPAVTGTLALLNELNHDNGGRPLLASTWKGLLLNTAIDGTRLDHIRVTHRDANGDPTTTARASGLMGPTVSATGLPGPDYFYGWGLVNAKAAADLLHANLRSESGCQHLCEFLLSDPSNNEVPTDNTIIEVPIEYDGTSPEMKIMICWSDPAFHQPGTAAFASGLVDPEVGPYDQNLNPLINDLDLTVEGPGGVIHRPWILDPASPLTPARAAQDTGTEIETNTVDNVEQVVISAPLPGTYTIKITHKGKLWDLRPVDPNQTGADDLFILESGKDQAVSLIMSGNAPGTPKRPGLTIDPFSPSLQNGTITSVLTIEGFVGVPYQLQISDSLETDDWQNVDPFFVLENTTVFKTVQHPENLGKFYRVVEVSPNDN